MNLLKILVSTQVLGFKANGHSEENGITVGVRRETYENSEDALRLGVRAPPDHHS